jgi:hypothetical protein
MARKLTYKKFVVLAVVSLIANTASAQGWAWGSRKDSSTQTKLPQSSAPSNPVGSKANGVACSSGADCQSGYCYPGPTFSQDTIKYCIAKELSCGVPGGAGQKLNGTTTYKGAVYKCATGEKKGDPAHWVPVN